MSHHVIVKQLRSLTVMDDRKTNFGSNQLNTPVEDLSQDSHLNYPKNMENSVAEGEDVEDWDEDRDDREIIQRAENFASLEAEKGLTIFTAAIFIIGEMAGSGVLALPYAIVFAGWTGIAMLILCCLASGYCGMVLGRSWTLLRERHRAYRGHVRYPYPAIGEKAYGRWASITVTICIQVTLFGKGICMLTGPWDNGPWSTFPTFRVPLRRTKNLVSLQLK